MTMPAAHSPYSGYRYPPEVIGYAVWLSFRFPVSLRMAAEMLAARGIIVSHEAMRQWAGTFGPIDANIRRQLPRAGDKWHLDEVQIRIGGKPHWLWQAVDQRGIVAGAEPTPQTCSKAPPAPAQEEADAGVAGADHR